MFKKDDILKAISCFAIFSAFLFIFILIYWYSYPYKILTFQEGNGDLIETTVKSGGYLRIHQHACKHKDLLSTVDRRFVDSIEYQVPIFAMNSPLGCSDHVELVYIPKALPIGKFHIRTIITYKVNPLRKITYLVQTKEFEIVK
jgi:hypothetical protein